MEFRNHTGKLHHVEIRTETLCTSHCVYLFPELLKEDVLCGFQPR